MAARLFSRSFNGGIISPEMWGRIDDVKNNTGLAECNNFYVTPQGPLVNRPGLQYVRAAKYAAKYTRMLPFRYSATQTTALEFGDAYIRFHSFGATLLTPVSGVSAWSNATAYTQGDLATHGGFTWYAVAANTNKQPDTNVYTATPAVTANWVVTVAESTSAPGGYTFVGTELPAIVTVGQQVYTTRVAVVGEWVFVGTPGGLAATIGDYSDGYWQYQETTTTYYTGYTGQNVTAPSGFWFKMSTLYELPSPYAEIDLPDLHYVQSADVLTITHPKYAPRELRRLAATKWTLVPVPFGSTLAAPAISTVTATTATTPSTLQTYKYVATRVSDDLRDESVASALGSASNQLFDTGARNTLALTVARCNVYKLSGAQYGYIGQTTDGAFVDDNIAADLSRTPPLNQTPFATDWPGAVCYVNQRRCFAGTPAKPQDFWLSKVGAEANLDYSIPLRDDDAINVRIASREANSIRHAVVVGDLLLLTDSAEWRVSSSGDVLTPSTVSVSPQSFIGANNVQPVTANNTAIYAAARGGHVRAVGFDFDVDSYVSVDLSLRAAHLFDYKTIRDIAYARGPIPIVWAVSSDGRLLGMTYVPEQQVYAWHTQDTLHGAFESVCVVGEGNDDILYAVVVRTINGATVRYIERLVSRYFASVAEAFFVDSGLTYSGAATTTLSGLSHLEGEEVYVFTNGRVHPPKTVVGGAVTLEWPATYAHVGLPIISHARTLPLAVEGVDGYGQGRPKNVTRAYLRVSDTAGLRAGPTLDRLRLAKPNNVDGLVGGPTQLATGELEIEMHGDWTDGGQVYVQQTDPVPCTLVSLTQEVAFGG